METGKVIFWYEWILIDFIVLAIPLLVCGLGQMIFLWYKVKYKLAVRPNALIMIGLCLSHFCLGFVLTIFLILMDASIYVLFPNVNPLIDDGWITLAICFVISECITILSFNFLYKRYVNKHNAGMKHCVEGVKA